MITLSIVRRVAALLGRIAYGIGIRRNVTRKNVAFAYPNLTQSERTHIERASYVNLAIVFCEFLYLRFASGQSIRKKLHVSNQEVLDDAMSEGRGVIVLSGHLANWEWIAISLALQLNKPIRLVIKNQRSRRADRFLQNMRSRFGNTVVVAGNVRGLFAALGRSELLAVLADQAAPASSIRVPFFGARVPTFEGVARIALRSRSPIVFVRSWRTPDGYGCEFERIDYSDIAEADANAVERLTARHTEVLEQAIRRTPVQWVWQHKRWKDAE